MHYCHFGNHWAGKAKRTLACPSLPAQRQYIDKLSPINPKQPNHSIAENRWIQRVFESGTIPITPIYTIHGLSAIFSFMGQYSSSYAQPMHFCNVTMPRTVVFHPVGWSASWFPPPLSLIRTKWENRIHRHKCSHSATLPLMWTWGPTGTAWNQLLRKNHYHGFVSRYK